MAKSKSSTKKPNGANRQQRRAEERAPQRKSSGKPMWLRVLIIVIMAVMVLGFFLVPLLSSTGR
ncbi:MAG: hypothetical protein MJ065_09020 [Oscillospiraceae bacterium]|nr:hypothetical protein [Oscillospiraceae bacterium]